MLKIPTTYNIISIDKSIKKKLILFNSESIEIKRTRINEIDTIISHFRSIIQYKDLTRLKIQRDDLEFEISDIKYNEKLSYYIQQTSQLVDKYNKLLNRKVSISFVKKKKYEKHQYIIDKELIISEYLKIAREYINIENIIIETAIKKFICKCGCELFDTSNDYIRICTSCGEQIKIFGSVSSYKDIDRINTSNKYKYDRRVHFRDTVYQYQGKQNNTIRQEVYDGIESKFKMYGLLSTSNVKCEKYKRINKEHIYIFLKENGHSKHYEDITRIWCTITGNKPPNISKIENVLFDEHEKMLDVYEIIKTKSRKNFLNAKYVLYQLLLKRGIKCDRYDFNVLKTAERLNYHNDTCKQIFDILEWTFTEIR
jgi:hypothetical protein